MAGNTNHPDLSGRSMLLVCIIEMECTLRGGRSKMYTLALTWYRDWRAVALTGCRTLLSHVKFKKWLCHLPLGIFGCFDVRVTSDSDVGSWLDFG